MALLLSQVLEKVKKPEKGQTISKAVTHEEHIRFHVESFTDPSDISRQATVFLEWVATLLPKDKFNIFVNLFKFPTPVIQLSNQIFCELERVYDGRNPIYDYQFTESFDKDDWYYYCNEILKMGTMWRKKSWDMVKTSINCITIVDLPQDQITPLPEPYFYFLNIKNVIDFGTKDNKIDYIIFEQPGNKVAQMDDQFYRIFSKTKEGVLDLDSVIEKEHALGYCPAQFFWSTELSQKNPDLKKSPLSPQLSNMDWLLFFSISKRHLDLYAPYPIYSAYAADCDFANNETGDYCDGGYLRDSNNNYKIYRNGTVEACPVCSQKRLAGVGSFIEIPVPTSKEDPDMRNPVQITTIDKTSLDYNVDEVKRIASEVFINVVGTGGDIQAKQSINEMQVTANFESKLSVLNSLKFNLEIARKFIEETICRLRYGDSFIGSTISMGTEFYISSVNDLYAQYKQAKENGASEAELDSINEQILLTQYRNDPTQLQRMIILKHLEPYRHLTQTELMTLAEKSLLNLDLLKIKINFNTFVNRFERENTNIIEFGSQLDFDSKIKIINEKFLEYVKTEQTRGKEPDTTTEQPGDPK